MRGTASRTGVLYVHDDVANWLRRLAIVGGAAIVVALGSLALAGWLPRNPEGDWFRQVEVPGQLGLLALVGVGLLVATRWPAPGSTMVALGGVGLGALSAISHPPVIAVLVSVAFLTPAVMLWVAWQRRETRGRILVLAGTTAGLLLGSWVAADAVHEYYFGPSHPVSAAVALDDPLVEWAWAGAVDDASFTVVVKPRSAAGEVAVTAFGASSGPVTATAPVIDGVARVRVDGLHAATTYSYGVSVDGAAAPTWMGSVRTFSAGGDDGPITIAFSSCAQTGSSGQVFDALRRLAPDLYVVTGDLHYSNIARNDETAFARAYDRVLTAPAQAALYRSVPIAYVWDDHDFSGNDGDAASASRPAARAAYERAVPHYGLVDDVTINQAFSVGGVRIVLLDTRSARVPGSTMLGADQLAWLEDELVSSAAGHDLVVVVSPTPWIAAADGGADTWGGFPAERAGLADVIAANDLGNVVIVGGDAHMVAIDDGSNSDYSTAGGAAVPVLHGGALDRPGSEKGGPYSEGTYPGSGQFGVIVVERMDGAVRVELSGHAYAGDTLVSYVHEVPLR